MEKYNLLTIWLGGWQQPSSVFLELYNTPNYSVRKIKESQRLLSGKKKEQSSPNGPWMRERLKTLLANVRSPITLIFKEMQKENSSDSVMKEHRARSRAAG